MTITTDRPSAPPLALDIAFGTRDATTCATCQRPMPAVDEPRFELETIGGRVLCALCSEKSGARGLRLATALLNSSLDDRAAGQHQAADDSLRAVLTGLEMLDAENGRPAPPAPNRAARRRQQRGRRR